MPPIHSTDGKSLRVVSNWASGGNTPFPPMLILSFLSFADLFHHTGPFLFFLLDCILFTLTITATETLGRETLIAKGGPRSKVLTALAPLDLQARCGNNPHIHVTESTETFVLSRNNGRGRRLWGFRHVAVASGKAAIGLAGGFLLALVDIGAWTSLSTHDAAPHAFG